MFSVVNSNQATGGPCERRDNQQATEMSAWIRTQMLPKEPSFDLPATPYPWPVSTVDNLAGRDTFHFHSLA
jgi:hypothetical protein